MPQRDSIFFFLSHSFSFSRKSSTERTVEFRTETLDPDLRIPSYVFNNSNNNFWSSFEIRLTILNGARKPSMVIFRKIARDYVNVPER